jgi:hypothetical protein
MLQNLNIVMEWNRKDYDIFVVCDEGRAPLRAFRGMKDAEECVAFMKKENPKDKSFVLAIPFTELYPISPGFTPISPSYMYSPSSMPK